MKDNSTRHVYNIFLVSYPMTRSIEYNDTNSQIAFLESKITESENQTNN